MKARAARLLSDTLREHAEIGRETLHFQTSHGAVTALKALDGGTGSTTRNE